MYDKVLLLLLLYYYICWLIYKKFPIISGNLTYWQSS